MDSPNYNIMTVEEWLYKRVLFWFYSFLHMSEDGLKVYVDKYNEGSLPPAICLALEAIEEMSG